MCLSLCTMEPTKVVLCDSLENIETEPRPPQLKRKLQTETSANIFLHRHRHRQSGLAEMSLIYDSKFKFKLFVEMVTVWCSEHHRLCIGMNGATPRPTNVYPSLLIYFVFNP